ncbi:MAG: nucleotide exchange factor GrpE [Proteobacteria bacterium]|nr:nucleotide exchange factor GrpE [Pseudomonadota bacterium]MCP4917715.1 nucleotide exchange factor GrpE [Pseudomonadota bacterium]
MSPDKPELENPDFSLNLSEELLAAAVEAADKRFAKKPGESEALDEDDDGSLDISFDEGPSTGDEIELTVDLSVDLDMPTEIIPPDDGGGADELAALNDELIARVAELEAERDALTAQHERRVAEVESVRGTCQKLQEQLKRAKELNLKMSVRANRLRDTQDRLKLRHEDAQAKVRSLEDLVGQARNQVRSSEDERERTRVRHVRELDEMKSFGTEGFFKDLLPVLDHLDLALTHADDTPPERMVEGVKMIFDQLGNTLRRMGLVRVHPEQGASFDPNQHDAMKHSVHPEVPEGHILAVLQTGYSLGKRLIRAARVSVSSGDGTDAAVDTASEVSEPETGPPAELDADAPSDGEE